jgi:gliding motility-associated-like protein
MKNVIFFLFVLNYNFLEAQNLVPNPSFEEFIECPMGYGQFDGFVKNWFSATNYTIHYFRNCGSISDVSVPQSYSRFQNPKSGEAFICGTYFKDLGDPDEIRSYPEVKLIQQLSKDSIYCVSFFVNVSNNSNGGVSNIDAYFSDTMVSVIKMVDDDWELPFLPQIKNQQGIITDTLNWIRMYATFKAKGGEQYLLLGNFNDDAHTTRYIYYLPPGADYEQGTEINIDDVCVTPAPAIAYELNLGRDTLYCGTFASRQLAAPIGFTNYLWSTGDTTSAILVQDTGQYWVRCDLECCTFYDTITLKLQSLLTTNLSDSIAICDNEIPYSVKAANGFDTYKWSNGFTTKNINITQNGVYALKAEYGCGVVYDSVYVAIKAVPDPPITNDTTYCTNLEIAPLTAIGNEIRWYNTVTDTTWFTEPNYPNLTQSSLNYWVTQTELGCESEKVAINVTVKDLPKFTLPQDSTICKSQSVTIAIQGDYNFLWNDGSSQMPRAINQMDVYTLEATNECGNWSDTMSVNVIDCEKCFYVPNIFSPNDDNSNDYFQVFPSCPLSSFNISIYDRWGELVYFSKEINAKWYGDVKNKKLPTGVYGYFIEYTLSNNGDKNSVKGDISIVK